MKIAVFFYFVGDLSTGKALYSSFFNKKPSADHGSWVEYEIKGSRFAIHLDEHKQEISDNEIGKKDFRGGTISFELINNSMEEFINKTKKMGFRLHGSIKTEPFGLLADIIDPWGNIINLVKYNSA